MSDSKIITFDQVQETARKKADEKFKKFKESGRTLEEIQAEVLGENNFTAETLRNLLSDIHRILTRFVVMPNLSPQAVALYIVTTHLVDYVQFAPLLILRSPEKRCGKTTLMDLIGELVRSPLAAVNASPAALFRSLDKNKPTLLLDEVDSTLSMKTETSEAIRGLLNSGHRKGRYSIVLRAEATGSGKDFEPRAFNTFGFKVLSGIGKVQDTLNDRAILVPLRRKKPEETADRLRITRLQPELDALRERIEKTVDFLGPVVEMADPDLPEELSDRARDNWEALLAIADVAGGLWPKFARSAAILFSHQEGQSEDEPGPMLLSDIQELFSERPYDNFLKTDEILTFLNDLDDRPWQGWSRGKPLTAAGLARLLRSYEIRPTKLSSHIRGYRREFFLESWDRYLNPGSNRHTATEDSNSIQDIELNDSASNGTTETNPPPATKNPAEPIENTKEVMAGGDLDTNPPKEPELDNSIHSKDLQKPVAVWRIDTGEPPEDEPDITPRLEIF